MHWINIHTETLRGVEFLGAEPIERATWLSLLGWCCAQENGGTIESCKEWTSRKWQQICGVTLEEVSIKSDLYEFTGNGLIIHFYPMEHQEKAEASRVNGKKGGRPRKTKEAETFTQQEDKPIGSVLVNLDETQGITKSEPSHNLNSKSKSKSNCKSKEIVLCPKTDGSEILKAIWEIYPAIGKRRSSKKQVAAEWKKIRSVDKPTVEKVTTSLKGWIACDEWQRDNNQAVQGVHLWIKNERWENTPEPQTTKPTTSVKYGI